MKGTIETTVNFGNRSKYAIIQKMAHEGRKMKTELNMIYWKGEKYWVGKLLERPDIMTQGETLAELEENMKEAYMLMTMEDVPAQHKIKKLELAV